ncbi:MAG: YcaO-like family protein, partial [Desulfovibrio sp.]|nr:YcaO-like family protein [Desulfovibrio sp.]
MNYVLVHSGTDGTTGYFNCVPDPKPGLADALRQLDAWPQDTFLRNWLVSALAKVSSPELQSLAVQFANSQTVSSFLHSLACAKPVAAAASHAWRDNIASHLPCPSADSWGIDPGKAREAACIMRSREGTLKRLWKSRSPVEAARPDQEQVLARAAGALAAAGILAGPEMRHEASLCPIALLREWHLDAGSELGRPYTLTGRLTAYGRGLKLLQARISCLMEIAERASAFAAVDAKGRIWGRQIVVASSDELGDCSHLDLNWLGAGHAADALYWMPGETAAGEPVLVPCQAACLFLNLDEPDLFSSVGSTGLAAGASQTQARLAALTEVIERDSHATTPFLPGACFIPQSRDPLIQGLLDDYRCRGIHVQMQDITTELGVPCYRSFVMGREGAIAQATGAGLDGKRAALSALTETPWPYSWATGAFSPSGRGLADLPCRFLEDLPNYSLADDAANLRL